jgi:hypothetical protein
VVVQITHFRRQLGLHRLPLVLRLIYGLPGAVAG